METLSYEPRPRTIQYETLGEGGLRVVIPARYYLLRHLTRQLIAMGVFPWALAGAALFFYRDWGLAGESLLVGFGVLALTGFFVWLNGLGAGAKVAIQSTGEHLAVQRQSLWGISETVFTRDQVKAIRASKGIGEPYWYVRVRERYEWRSITGWLPRRDAEEIAERLRGVLGVPAEVESG